MSPSGLPSSILRLRLHSNLNNMLLNEQTHIDPITPMPTDRVDDTSVVQNISSETITWFYLTGGAWASATGQAAGTIVYGKTVYDGILNSSKSSLGGRADTSVSFAAATRVSQRVTVPAGVFSKIESMTPTNQKAEISRYLTTAGDYAVDHRRGRVWANMKAVVANDSISYSVKTNTSGGTAGNTADIIKVGGTTVPVDDAAYAGGQPLMPPIAAVADETTPDSVDEGDAGYVRMTLTRFLKVSQGDLISGEDQTNNLIATHNKPTAVSTYAFSKDVSSALEASSISKNATGNFHGAFGVIDKSATTGLYYIQILDSASLPADGAVTHLVTPLPVSHVNGTDSSFDFGVLFALNPANAANGIVIVLSTTMVTKTIAGSFMFSTVAYK